MKKKYSVIVIVVLILVGILTFMLYQRHIEEGRKYEIEKIENPQYFIVKQSSGYGVINVNGDIIVEPIYDNVIIPNPEKAVFICYEEENTKIFNDIKEQIFNELLQTANNLNEEQKRYIREGFDNDEELTIYDMLFKKSLSKEDIKKIKELAKSLLKKIKDLLAEMDSPFDKDTTIAEIQNQIRNTLFTDLPDSCFADLDVYRKNIFDYLKTIYGAA